MRHLVRRWCLVRRKPPPPLFRHGRALDWIVAKLAGQIVAATLTRSRRRRILAFQDRVLPRRKGVAANGSTAKPSGDVVVAQPETVELHPRAGEARTGEGTSSEQV